jgi:adenosylhomocysteine nucleosidase
MFMNDIIVFALKSEAPNLFQRYKNIFEIGVGKVNAAINTANLIHRYNPKRIINLGTAGGITVGTGIYRIKKLFQHDVNLIDLGYPPGHHMNDNLSYISLEGEGKICGSGDLFVTQPERIRIECDIIEMEAYSVAKACLMNNVEVEVFKYITDTADENASKDWQTHVASGELLYEHVLRQLNIKLEEN